MRTIQEIKNKITARWLSNPEVVSAYNLSEDIANGKTFEQMFSSVSLTNIRFYVMAFCAWTVEALFEVHKTEVQTIIDSIKPHTVGWYSTKAKEYQHGADFVFDGQTGKYDNTGKTEQQIADSKIVAFAAISENQSDNKLVAKAAKLDGGNLTALTPGEKAGLNSYMRQIKDAGVFLVVESYDAEPLKIKYDIYYNPSIIAPNDNVDFDRIDGTANNVVATAINLYLKNVEFDGTIILAKMTDALQKVDGVEIPHLQYFKYLQAGYNPEAADDTLWVETSVTHKPLAGYAAVYELNLEQKIPYSN